MAAKRGSDLLIKIGDGGSPPTYVTLGGLRTSSVSISASGIDLTDGEGPDADQWGVLLEGYGALNMTVSGSCVFKNAATQQQAQNAALTQQHLALQIIVPDYGAFTGSFKVTSYNYTGEHAGALQADVALQGAGIITWTPE